MPKRRSKTDSWLRLRLLKQTSDSWEFGYTPAALQIAEAPDPHMLMVGERGTGLIRSTDITATAPVAADLRDAAFRAMMSPMAGCERARPAEFVVVSTTAQRALTLPLLRAGVSVRKVDELPLVNDAVAALHEHLSEGPPPLPTPLFAYSEAIHSAAARLARLAPWEWLRDGDVISLHLDAGDWSAPVAVVLGAAGEVFGLALYRTLENYQSAAEAGRDDDAAGAELMDSLTVWLDLAEDLRSSDVQAFDASGLATADGLYPRFMRIHPGGLASAANDEQSARVLRLALPAVVTFLERHEEPLRRHFSRLSHHHRSADGLTVEVESRPDWHPDAQGQPLPLAGRLPLDEAPLIDGDCAGLLASLQRPMLMTMAGLSHAEAKRQEVAPPGPDLPAVVIRAAGAAVARWSERLDAWAPCKLLVIPLPHLGSLPVVALKDDGEAALFTHLPLSDRHHIDALLHTIKRGGKIALLFAQGPATRAIRTMNSRACRAVRLFDLVGPEELERLLGGSEEGPPDSSTTAASGSPAIATTRCYDIRVALDGISPAIWRRFLLPVTATLYDLHLAIQDAFGWEYAHLAQFQAPGRHGEVIAEVSPVGRNAATGIPLRRLVDGGQKKWVYVYDFGDWWQHRISVRKTEEVPGVISRRLLAGKRACPPEDCGSAGGYHRFCEFVETGEDPYGDSAEELSEWIGDWRPEVFDLEATQAAFDR